MARTLRRLRKVPALTTAFFAFARPPFPLHGVEWYARSKMSGVIIFVSSGLFVYWLSRTFTLLYGSDNEVEEMLAHDLWLCRKIVLLVRSAFPPPTEFIG